MVVTEDFAKRFYLEEYVAELKIQWLTIATIQFYTEWIERFMRYSEFVDYRDFNNFIKLKFAYYAISKRDITNNTINKYYRCIKKYCDFLKANELVDKVYIDRIQKVKVVLPMPKSLTEEEVEKIRAFILSQTSSHGDFIQMRNYIALETFVYTGIRRSELTNLKKSNIYETHLIIEQGKGNKDRIIYIPKYFSKELKDWIAIQNRNAEYVFCDKSGNQWTGSAIWGLFKRIEKAMGFKVHPHLLRHTYASICVKRGINLYTLQQQMGHTSLKTTSIYLYLNSKENLEEMQKLRI